MAYGVTTNGFVIKPFQVIRDEIDAYQRANIDPGLTLTDQSNLGQQNVAVTEQCAELWEACQAIYAATYPRSANGWSLDEAVSLTGTERSQNSKTTVTGQVTLNPDKALPAGSVANLTNQPSVRFVTLAEVPANPAGGSFDVEFEAEIAGATQVSPGQLSEIAEPVTGWTAVTNAAAGDTGDAREEDDELRLKQQSEIRVFGSANVDAIRADLISEDGANCDDARVTENDKGIVVGGLKPHSIYCVVRGGTSDEVIARTIFESKAGGIDTNGSISEDVEDTQGETHEILFDYGTELTYYAIINVQVTDEFDAVQGPIDIKANVSAYVNSLGIGDDVIHNTAECAARVTGVYDVTNLYHDFSASPTSQINLVVAGTEYASSDTANITVNVTVI
jgi:uncharacterized phage protein gp47/JayE